MHNNLIDNSSTTLSMQSYLKECILDEDIDKIQIATGYWDIPGMALVLDELKSFLDRKETSLELLIGKDPYVYTSLLVKPKYKDANFPSDFIKTDIHDLEIKDEYKDVINLLLRYCDNGKIQIRIYSKNEKNEEEFLHSKCYIFSGTDRSFGIIGSSNFTKKGLLGNAELNYLETDPTRITASQNMVQIQKVIFAGLKKSGISQKIGRKYSWNRSSRSHLSILTYRKITLKSSRHTNNILNYYK